ncbi:helix-turn-helix domain-containing protein, partial [Solibacillus silvestris]|uniref:helix-turn-helix domain-containing protein n=1 Tax=Solibacillus silvestris TaxID=76853 RepID=UPI003F7E510D
MILLVSLVEREWAVSYSLRGMSKLLERMQFSPTRPTYTLANVDSGVCQYSCRIKLLNFSIKIKICSIKI